MKYLIKTLIVAVLPAALLAGCASTGTVVVRSEPSDAQVFMIDSRSGQSSLLGRTPLTVEKNLADDQNGQIFQLKIEKEGYEAKTAAVAGFSKETTFVDIKLNSLATVSNEIKKSFEQNRALLSEAIRLASASRFAEALARIEKILEVDPKNDEVMAAKGSLFYLMKDYDSAQAAWMKALEFNPNNDSVRSSLVDLKIQIDGTNGLDENKEGQR